VGSLARRLRLLRLAWRTIVGWLDLDGSRNRVVRRTELDGHPRPVLLLQGFFSTRRALSVLEARLRRDGYGVISLHLGGLRRAWRTRGVDGQAEYVRQKVERLYQRHPGLGPLSIVGHSKGGVVAAHYVQQLGGWRRVEAVVALGSPFHGTWLAWLALPAVPVAPFLLQLAPGSRFLRRLLEGAWPATVRLASLWSRRDELAAWPSPVLDPRGGAAVRNVEVDSDHFQLLTRRDVYLAIRQELEAARAVRRAPLRLLAGGGGGS